MRADDRIEFFQRMLTTVKNVPGSIVECGVYMGHSLTIFGVLAVRAGQRRRIYGYDAFAPVQFGDVPASTQDARLETVKTSLDTAGWDSKITLVKGLFSDTLPHHPDGEPIAILHIDADYYESYRDALTCLWPKVAPGGVVILDEYASAKWRGAATAVDEFLSTLLCEAYQLVPDVRWYIHKQVEVLDGR